ncbi:AAA family ATPase [Acetobacter sp. AN02]|uniref:AAA family ATPase n=1 Tax=Acetobacter sp. AN02 TaxID=2894186 RepID=UPI00243460A9|nr:AAA family ATPase [Acetobacter sp. AN02]MDG6094227.1 AAA family ATPase [Acetobacter sp. AN02]
MRILSLEIEWFRKFRGKWKVEGFGEGLNLLAAANEAGKSTIFEAMRAVLFCAGWSGKSDLVRSFQSSGSGMAPRVALEFEEKGQRFRLEKQFLKSPRCVLEGPSGSFQGADAEARLEDILGIGKASSKTKQIPDVSSVSGFIWVEQGGGFQPGAPGERALETIRSALEAEAGFVTDGRLYDGVFREITTDLEKYRTEKSGKVTGALLTAQKKAEQAVEYRERAERQARDYADELEALEDCTRRLGLRRRELEDPAPEEERRGLEVRLRIAREAAGTFEKAEALWKEQKAVVAAAEADLKALEAAEREAREAAAEVARQEGLLPGVQARLDEAVRLAGEKDGLRKQAVVAEDHAVRAARSVEEAHGERQFLDGLRDARERLRQLAETDARTAQAERVVAADLPAKITDRLEGLEKEVLRAEIAAQAQAVRMEIAVHDGTGILVDGEKAGSGTVVFQDPVTVRVGDHATLVISPPEGSGRDALRAQEAAEAALRQALEKAGVATVAQARARGASADRARQDLVFLRERRSGLCPADGRCGLAAGEDALRAFCALHHEREPADFSGQDLPDLTACGKAVQEARVSVRETQAAFDVAENIRRVAAEEVRRLRQEAGFARQTLDRAQERAMRLREARREDVSAAGAEQARERLMLRTAEMEQARQNRDRERPEELERRLEGLARARRQLEEECQSLRERIAAAEVRVEAGGRAGLPGELARAREEEEAAREELERLTAEADMLTLLRDTLREASSEISRKFAAPVAQRSLRYLSRIFPDCEPEFDETIALKALGRKGQSEAVDTLSRGTQEQIALLTRLAFAGLLREQGVPVSMMLDDPLVWSDDLRLEAATGLLQEEARMMQIVLLTCHERAFRHLDARRVTLREV